jgi:hypothetical protein
MMIGPDCERYMSSRNEAAIVAELGLCKKIDDLHKEMSVHAHRLKGAIGDKRDGALWTRLSGPYPQLELMKVRRAKQVQVWAERLVVAVDGADAVGKEVSNSMAEATSLREAINAAETDSRNAQMVSRERNDLLGQQSRWNAELTRIEQQIECISRAQVREREKHRGKWIFQYLVRKGLLANNYKRAKWTGWIHYAMARLSSIDAFTIRETERELAALEDGKRGATEQLQLTEARLKTLNVEYEESTTMEQAASSLEAAESRLRMVRDEWMTRRMEVKGILEIIDKLNAWSDEVTKKVVQECGRNTQLSVEEMSLLEDDVRLAAEAVTETARQIEGARSAWWKAHRGRVRWGMLMERCREEGLFSVDTRMNSRVLERLRRHELDTPEDCTSQLYLFMRRQCRMVSHGRRQGNITWIAALEEGVDDGVAPHIPVLVSAVSSQRQSQSRTWHTGGAV